MRWVVEHVAVCHGDPRQLVLAGHSAGAYNAAMLAYDPRWLGGDRTAVRAMIGLARTYDFLPLQLPSVIAAFGNAVDPASTQPINCISPGAPPALLATDDKDDLVAPRNSDTLAVRLQAAGLVVERRRFPRVRHIGLITATAEPFRARAGAGRHGQVCRPLHAVQLPLPGAAIKKCHLHRFARSSPPITDLQPFA